MKIGRNEACPCGSGKKYKKCCLGKNAGATRATIETRRARRPEPKETRRARPPEPTEAETRWRRFWDDYRKAPVDAKLAMARRVIEEEKDFDGELAFDLAAGVVEALQKVSRLEEAEQILDLIQARHPEAYQAELAWFSDWRVEHALVLGGDVETPFRVLAQDPVGYIEGFCRVVGRLCYHGRSTLLHSVLMDAWPTVRDSHGLMDYAKLALREVTFSVALNEHFARNRDLGADDPAFLEDVAKIVEIDAQRLKQIIEHRWGRSERPWEREDFGGPSDDDVGLDHLHFLTLDFAHDLEARQGWPGSRADLGARAINQYLANRKVDEAPASPRSADETMDGQRSRASLRVDSAARSPQSQFLIPTVNSADYFAAMRLQLINPDPYVAGGFYLALPLWHRFLEARGLRDEKEAPDFESALHAKFSSLPEFLDDLTADPVLVRDVKAARMR